jgi:acyl dehydratase
MVIPGYSMSTLTSFTGRELGVSNWTTLDQHRIDEFARITGDEQWIHVDLERAARESPFGGTIAHGYLTLALLASLAMQIGVVPADAKAGLNYGLDKVRFMSAVRAGARVRNRVILQSTEDKGGGRMLVKTQNTLEIEGEPKPALVAETLVMLVG